MLILSRRIGERIWIEPGICLEVTEISPWAVRINGREHKLGSAFAAAPGVLVTVTEIHIRQAKCRIGVAAPRTLRVDREEVLTEKLPEIFARYQEYARDHDRHPAVR